MLFIVMFKLALGTIIYSSTVNSCCPFENWILRLGTFQHQHQLIVSPHHNSGFDLHMITSF